MSSNYNESDDANQRRRWSFELDGVCITISITECVSDSLLKLEFADVVLTLLFTYFNMTCVFAIVKNKMLVSLSVIILDNMTAFAFWWHARNMMPHTWDCAVCAVGHFSDIVCFKNKIYDSEN